MIFGLGRGKISVDLEKYNFYPGETIKGTISLQLKKPIQATCLKVAFIGMKIVTERVRTSDIPPGRMESSSDLTDYRQRTDYIPLYSFELTLDKEKEYFKQEYSFAIKIPNNILEEKCPKVEGTLGKVAEIVRLLSHEATRIQWYVEARLAIPKSFDITKRVDITLG